MKALELMYVRAATFLRDVLQYFVPGLLFLILLFPGLFYLDFLPKDGFMKEYSWIITMLDKLDILYFIIPIILPYLIGHILFLLSDLCIYKTQNTSTKIRTSNLNKDRRIEQLKNYLESIKDLECNATYDQIDKYLTGKEVSYKTNDLEKPVHLYYEMCVFLKRPELHFRFIERYNVLMFMRQTMFACFSLLGIAYFLFALAALKCHENVCCFFFSFFSLSLLLFGIACLFFRKYKKTELDFWKRVFTAYLISDAEKKNGT